MELRSTDEARTNIVEYTKRYLNILKQKKELDEDIKALKEEFKEEGVPVGIVTSAINLIKSQKKKTDSEKIEFETIKDWLEKDEQVDNDIGALIS